MVPYFGVQLLCMYGGSVYLGWMDGWIGGRIDRHKNHGTVCPL
jgi:hypothetical protein